jgi:hypothetical protein
MNPKPREKGGLSEILKSREKSRILTRDQGFSPLGMEKLERRGY